MDKNSTSSTENNSTTSTRDEYLKHLNKLSHKISKPVTRKPNFDPLPPPPPPPPKNAQPPQQPPNQHQPPVYNINKNDFRDVVQKLTGSPAHTPDRFATPPPIHPPKTQSSRLQRIRPPPLAQLASRPPTMLDGAVSAQVNNNNNPNPVIPPMGSAAAHFGGVIGRSTAPLSPLPPFPTVHAAAESPVSAYMRYLHNSLNSGESNQNMNQKQQHFSGYSPLAPLVSPRWTNLTTPEQDQSQNHNQNQLTQREQQQGVASSLEPAQPPPPAPVASSPLPFGCLNSPSQLGFPQLPLSPTMPVPSPRWRGF